jgi:hypothetical protein
MAVVMFIERVGSIVPFQDANGMMDYTINTPFDALVLQSEDNSATTGMTVSTLLNDCDYGSRWLFTTSRPLPAPYRSDYDAFTCSLFVRLGEGETSRPVKDLAFVLRRVAFYRAVSSSTAGDVLRAGWVFWMNGHEGVVSMAEPSHAFWCPPAPTPAVGRNQAVSECYNWITMEGESKMAPATLPCPISNDVDRLVNYLRRSGGRAPDTGTGVAAEQLTGYVTWIGQMGTNPQFDNSALVTAYQPFGANEPKGPYPSVLANDMKWYSVSPDVNFFDYCCESTGASDVERRLTGRVNILMQRMETARAIPTVLMPVEDGASPFAARTAGLPSVSAVPLYGATVSIHAQDCQSSGLRWIATSAATVANISSDILLCSVVLQPLTWNTTWTAGEAAAALKLLRLVSVRTDRTLLPGQNGSTVRVNYAYLTSPTSAIVNGPAGDVPSEGPHLYQCFYVQLRWRDAADACAAWGGGLGYLATPQSDWEQRVIERLRGNTARADDAWIGLHTWFTEAAGHDFKMLNGDRTGVHKLGWERTATGGRARRDVQL